MSYRLHTDSHFCSRIGIMIFQLNISKHISYYPCCYMCSLPSEGLFILPSSHLYLSLSPPNALLRGFLVQYFISLNTQFWICLIFVNHEVAWINYSVILILIIQNKYQIFLSKQTKKILIILGCYYIIKQFNLCPHKFDCNLIF